MIELDATAWTEEAVMPAWSERATWRDVAQVELYRQYLAKNKVVSIDSYRPDKSDPRNWND